MSNTQNAVFDLYAQLLTMAAIVKNAKNAPRMSTCSQHGAFASGLTKEEIKKLEKIPGVRFHGGALNRCMALYTWIGGEIIQFSFCRAIPLEHSCPADCYRIHLTTPDPEGASI